MAVPTVLHIHYFIEKDLSAQHGHGEGQNNLVADTKSLEVGRDVDASGRSSSVPGVNADAEGALRFYGLLNSVIGILLYICGRSNDIFFVASQMTQKLCFNVWINFVLAYFSNHIPYSVFFFAATEACGGCGLGWILYTHGYPLPPLKFLHFCKRSSFSDNPTGVEETSRHAGDLNLSADTKKNSHMCSIILRRPLNPYTLSSKVLVIQAFFLMVLGLTLVVFPSLLTGGVDGAERGGTRLIGAAYLYIAFIYLQAGMANSDVFALGSFVLRGLVEPIFLILFVIFNLASNHGLLLSLAAGDFIMGIIQLVSYRVDHFDRDSKEWQSNVKKQQVQDPMENCVSINLDALEKIHAVTMRNPMSSRDETI
eukprot:g6531.t1